MGYVPLEHTWGATLEQLIGIRVLKCGVEGYGSRQERHKLETVVAKAGQPRLVIIGYMVANDLLDDYFYPNRTVIDGYMVTRITLADEIGGGRRVRSDDELRAGLKSFREPKPPGFVGRAKDLLAAHSVIYDRLRNWTPFRHLAFRLGMADPPRAIGGDAAFYPAEMFPWLEGAWGEHLTNLRQLKLAVEAVGAALVIVIIPTDEQIYRFSRYEGDRIRLEYPNRRLAEFFRKEGIAFLDLIPEFRRHARHDPRPMLDARHDLYWPYDGHLNVKGNRLAGLVVAHFVLEHDFVSPNQQLKEFDVTEQ
ncbi:hypothetical protein YTPLAS18_18410 [Nitrospira sp.]|nr:hypothetical protein YTPLAS18_18410 [Nitrospira sp.]